MLGQNLRSIVVVVLLIAVACTANSGGDDEPTPEPPDAFHGLSTTEAPATTAPLLQAEWSPPGEIPPDVLSALVGVLEEQGGAGLLPAQPPSGEWERAALVVFVAAEGAETILHVGPAGSGLTLRSRPSALPCGTAWEAVDVRGQPGCVPNSGPAAELRWVEEGVTFDVTYAGLDQAEAVTWLETWLLVP